MLRAAQRAAITGLASCCRDIASHARLIDDAFLAGNVNLPRDSLEVFLLQAHRRGRGELTAPVLEQARRTGIYISERIANSIARNASS